MSGWHDVPLSATERRQAALLAQRLQLEGNIAAMYSSPLRRAADTAAAVAESTGVPIAFLPQLKEIYCGEVDGRPVEQVQRSYRALWEKNLRQDDADFRWPGGESYREFRARCLEALAHVVTHAHRERVLVVTHAGVISQLIGHLRDVSPARWESFRPGNASITVIEWHGDLGAMLTFDDRAHLQRDDSPALTSKARRRGP